MFLSFLKLWNFRRFGSDGEIDLKKPNLVVPLRKGLNVLVGENDSGKSAIIDAIRLTLGTHSAEWTRIADEDFFKDSKRLRIELTFSELSDDEGKNFIEWLTLEGAPPNCCTSLAINFDVSRVEGKIVPADVRAGADSEGHPLTAEAREYLKTTYLRPLRDASSELVPRKNSRLSQILHGHELFKGKDDDHDLKKLHDQFNVAVEAYFEIAGGEAGPAAQVAAGAKLKGDIDRYLKSFYGEEKKSVINAAKGTLKAILEKLEISLRDEINPGLGTLNRLFMASELIHLNKSNWHGVRLCLIEELEAHLHPQAQMQVIEALQQELGIQIILTTHSPNLASKVKLDSLAVCAQGHVFPMGTDQAGQPYSELEAADHQFLEWFLDATKANLFFARGVLLVEGWSEELLLPALARAMKRAGLIDRDLTEARVSVVNVGGLSQLRYSGIFARKGEPRMNVPVAIVTDVDVPTWLKTVDCDAQGKPLTGADGKLRFVYAARPAAEVDAETSIETTALSLKYDQQSIKAFVAPKWTLEYSLSKSPVFGEAFGVALKRAHPQVDPGRIEEELARKLISRSLDKTELAHRLALALDADSRSAAQAIVPRLDDPAAAYLLLAIKHACRA